MEWRLNQIPLPPEKARTEELLDDNGARSVLSLPWRDLTTGANFLNCLATIGLGGAPETVMYLFPINLTCKMGYCGDKSDVNPLPTNDAPMRHGLSISLWEFIWVI